MALPTLPSYWLTRRPLDKKVARQRQQEQEAQLRQQWEQNSRYFKTTDIHSSKLAEWSSKTSYQRSMNAYHREKMKEEKRMSLEARRERLRQLVLEEQDLLAAELEELRLNVNLQERKIREQHKDLKSAREERRKLIAEQLLYDHWKKNNPRLREVRIKSLPLLCLGR
ncbi:Trichoplein keratin filament-binding protein [Cricetulus griseus]|uniref:Trichoplein keratin filament-binding protein n=1 Tax=Cricetulus griseus TaxID=10029 RepID=G3HI75_CRIGR|nr:Trichoplein keratin filament-binding protein [Cricetulus griseus]